MFKRILKTLSGSFCIYLLTAANVIHAIVTDCFDWLLWLSIGLSALAIILTIVCSAGEDDG